MSLSGEFTYDVFLGGSSKDRNIVRALAKRLRNDGLRVWYDEREIGLEKPVLALTEEGLEQSRTLVLCISRHVSGSEWARLEAGIFRFRDPLNHQRRLISLRLDSAPLEGPLKQLTYLSWLPDDRNQTYPKLREACLPPAVLREPEKGAVREQSAERVIQLDVEDDILAYALSTDGKRVLTGGSDRTVRVCDLETGKCLSVFEGHKGAVHAVAWTSDHHFVLSGGHDNENDNALRMWDLETGHCVRTMFGHKGMICDVTVGPDRRALTASEDYTLRLWDLDGDKCLRILEGHSNWAWCAAFSADQRRALSGSKDRTVRLWDLETGQCLRVLEGHQDGVRRVAWSVDQRYALSGSHDHTIRVWDIEAGHCLHVLEGHTDNIQAVAWSSDGYFALSSSSDNTARLWDVRTGHCLRILTGHKDQVRGVVWSVDGCHAYSGDRGRDVRVWDLTKAIAEARDRQIVAQKSAMPEQVQYTNAKVLLVGETSAGKTGLSNRLATGQWRPSDGSTVGSWSTQWKLPESEATHGVAREIWLWDFAGQADQRLIHQLFMDRTALILLLFNADQDDVLPGLRDWLTAVRRCIADDTPQFLVAGRIDTGFKASRTKLQSFAAEQGLEYFETSAKEGTGCPGLYEAIQSKVPWEKIPVTTSERFFKLIKDEILKLRDEGQILHTFKELRDILWHRLPTDAQLTDDKLRTVIGHLDAPGAVKELGYGSYILLAPEWINAYAQAVIRTLRSDEKELGAIPLQSISEGKLLYQSVSSDGGIVNMKRLPPADERVVLGEMERRLVERGLCLRQGDKMVFPSYCGRDRPPMPNHPSIFVSYAVKGYLDEIYATLIVKMADSESFSLRELWRDAADFDTLEGEHRMGVKLTRESASNGDVSVYFGPGVTSEEQVIFANYIHAHLAGRSEQVQRLRYYVCPDCHTAKGNPNVLMERLVVRGKLADTECDKCGTRFPLWDKLERKFSSKAVRLQVEGLRVEDEFRLDARRKGKLLALEVAARITSADQKCFDIPGVEDEGIDMEVEFTDNDGRGTGKRLYLQLKAGNSYLQRRKDGTEVFRIKKQSWVTYWLRQGRPVLLVVGTFCTESDDLRGASKERFSDIRWMEISELLRQESENGKKQVKQIVFKGQRLDAMSVRRWRDQALR